MSLISLRWLCLIEGTGRWWVSDFNTHSKGFPPKELPFQIAILSFTRVSWSKNEMWVQLSHYPLISWPTTQWPVFPSSVSDSGYSGDLMGKYVSYSSFCCPNRVEASWAQWVWLSVCSQMLLYPPLWPADQFHRSAIDFFLYLFCHFKGIWGEKKG